MNRLVYLLLIVFASQVYAANGVPGVAGNTAKDPEAILRAKWEKPMKNPSDPEEILQVKWDAIAKVLRENKIDLKQKEKAIVAIINPIFDFSLMSKLVLGKTNYSKFKPEEYQKFSKLFVKRLKDSYREKISLYKDEKFNFKPAQKKKTSLHVPMELISGDKKITVVHKLRKVGKGWKIYDMELQGVSIVSTYRSQFNDILAHGTVKQLLTHLEKPVTSDKQR